MKTGHLPEWATLNKADGRVEVDPDVVYPMYLEKLGYGLEGLTQAQLETARLCFTEDLFRITGAGLRLRILKKDKWALKNFDAGKPIVWQAEYRRLCEAGKAKADS